MNPAPFVPAWTGSGYCVARVRPDGSMVAELDAPDADTAEREAARLSREKQAQAECLRRRPSLALIRNRRRVRFFPDEDFP